MYDQISILDEVAKEAHIIVPYHNAKAFASAADYILKQGNGPEEKVAFERVGARFIIGEEYMCSVTYDYCVIEALPPTVKLDNFRNLGPSTDKNLKAAVSGMLMIHPFK